MSVSVLFYYWLTQFSCQMDSGFISQCGPQAGKVKCLPPPPLLCLSSKSGAPHAAVCGDCAVPRCLDRSQPLLWPTFSVWCLTLFINPGVCHSGTETWDGSGGTRKGGETGGGVNIMLNLCFCVKRSLSHGRLIGRDNTHLLTHWTGVSVSLCGPALLLEGHYW